MNPEQDETTGDRDRKRVSGPDPDAPPWAGRRRGEAGDGDERGEADEGDEAGEGDERPAGDDARAGDEGAGTGGQGDERPGPAGTLAEVAPGLRPPAPPRRTGVFLDPEDLRDHVGGLLRAILGGYAVDAFGNYTFVHEDARVFVTVGASPIGPQVGVFSVTNIGIELTPQLGSFLLTTNHRLGFGSFSYDPQNQAVWLRHALLGTTLDGPELQAAVASVASTAAAYDDEIRDAFGGRTFTEAPSDLQRRMEPPEPSQGPHPGPSAGGYL